MNYAQYKQLYDEILADPNPKAPYDNPDYQHYTQLNRSRMKRWDKQLTIADPLLRTLQQLDRPQHWIILSEPWCGDAAHSVPFLMAMTQQNKVISYDIQLRDSPPFLIEHYLTRGSKSIPKLIVRDAQGTDLFTWGPRPKPIQQLMEEMKAAGNDMESIILAMQNWYNEDQGRSLCAELLTCFQQANLQNK